MKAISNVFCWLSQKCHIQYDCFNGCTIASNVFHHWHRIVMLQSTGPLMRPCDVTGVHSLITTPSRLHFTQLFCTYVNQNSRCTCRCPHSTCTWPFPLVQLKYDREFHWPSPTCSDRAVCWEFCVLATLGHPTWLCSPTLGLPDEGDVMLRYTIWSYDRDHILEDTSQYQGDKLNSIHKPTMCSLTNSARFTLTHKAGRKSHCDWVFTQKLSENLPQVNNRTVMCEVTQLINGCISFIWVPDDVPFIELMSARCLATIMSSDRALLL